MRRKYFLFLVVAVLMIGLFAGCEKETDETVAQDSLVEEKTVSNELETVSAEPVDDRIIDLSDYSSYLKKIWIEKEWSSKDYGWSDSLVITKIENGHIEGYYGSVRDDYFNLSVGQEGLYPFKGEIYDGVAECEYIDVRNNLFTITFYENDYIRVERDVYRNNLFRPYHVSDWQFRGDSITYEVELDSWGTVTLFYANLEDRHSYPWVLLLDGQGNILYKFPGRFLSDSKVSEVVIEDVNGDGLKDVEVITCMNGSDEDRTEWYFCQLEDGLFYLEKYNGNSSTDILPFLTFDWTAQEVLFHPITPMDSARGWVFSLADVDFDGNMEVLITFTAMHCGDNSLYIYKQDEEKVFSLADTYATFREDIEWRLEGYEELSPYLAIDLLDAYVNEEGEYRYLSLDYTSMGGGTWGGYGELRLYVTTLEQDAQPVKLAEIQFNENESFEGMEIFFQEERVDEPKKLHELLEQYMAGYTKVKMEYKTSEVSFSRDIVGWNENEKRQCLEDLYESLENILSRP